MMLWCDDAHDAIENMRRDVRLLNAVERGEVASPVLRLFRFAPAGITLGHGQSAERELDLARCSRDGVITAIRPTGGRAIFHADEWTYSFSAKIADPDWGGSLSVAYDRLGALLLASLARLGVPAERAEAAAARASRMRGAGGALRRAAAAAAPCFATTTRHEIVRAGRKIVGSAQRRTATALLQQGSVLLSDRHLRLADYLAVPESERETIRAELGAASTHIGDILGEHAALARWAEAIAASTQVSDFRRGASALPLTA
jgi:lipoate-protein ligase A